MCDALNSYSLFEMVGTDGPDTLFFQIYIYMYWPAHPDDPQRIRLASVIEFSVCGSVCLCVGVFWANFLISGRRHVIVARVTIEFAAG